MHVVTLKNHQSEPNLNKKVLVHRSFWKENFSLISI